jgi:hypothetical protein
VDINVLITSRLQDHLCAVFHFWFVFVRTAYSRPVASGNCFFFS